MSEQFQAGLPQSQNPGDLPEPGLERKDLEVVGVPVAVPVPVPPHVRLIQSIAFALSAVLSPYIVLPLGTITIIGSYEHVTRTFLVYAAASVFFSTILPALFVLFQIWRGKITDVHVMEREQRGGPFLVAIFSSALGAWVLKAMGAPMEVWGISAVLTINGVILTGITTVWKISMHVAVLSATVLANVVMIQGIDARPLFFLIPSLIWARVTRQRHTVWQGLAGAGTAMLITGIALSALYFVYDQMWKASVMKLINGLR
ncbi:MAG: hypothetical protein JWN98_2603 [Abditibacteriota bacterium]|nr:hypothetical protein [Abditibacteriota bacterium]